ncbi:MAG: hypothetical protein ACFFKA_04115 [Candidatus Thorarchaeota archaeon]
MYFRINEFLSLRLENNQTRIYIKEEPFKQCSYLLLNIPKDSTDFIQKVDSIDEAEALLDKFSAKHVNSNYYLTPSMEFWGHCSNLQAWVENNYDTRILHRNLAFPLLKALVKLGDLNAKRVFKEEIMYRIMSGYPPVLKYLIENNYLDYFSIDELKMIGESKEFILNLLGNQNAISELKTIFDTNDIFALIIEEALLEIHYNEEYKELRSKIIDLF